MAKKSEQGVNGVADVVETLSIDAPHTFTTSRGIVLGLKRVPRFLIMDIDKQMPDPKPPKVMVDIDGTGHPHAEPNPNDPEYKDALREHSVNKGMTVMRAFITLGTFVKDVPEGVEPPDSDVWLDDLVELGFTPARTGRARYYDWLRMYALLDDETERLWDRVGRYSGLVMDGAVAQAQESFPGNAERGADSEPAAPAPNPN